MANVVSPLAFIVDHSGWQCSVSSQVTMVRWGEVRSSLLHVWQPTGGWWWWAVWSEATGTGLSLSLYEWNTTEFVPARHGLTQYSRQSCRVLGLGSCNEGKGRIMENNWKCDVMREQRGEGRPPWSAGGQQEFQYYSLNLAGWVPVGAT